MPWPPRQPSRDEIDDDASLAAFDTVIERCRRYGGDPTKDAGYYGRLLSTPVLANLLSEIGRTVRAIGDSGRSFSHAQREFVDQVLSKDLATNLVQGMHLNDALATGVRLEAIEAIRYGREEDLTAAEAQLADFIRRVVGGRIDAESWNGVEATLGERGTIEYTIFILFLQLTMRLMQSAGMAGPTDEAVDSMIADFKSGVREPADFRSRIG